LVDGLHHAFQEVLFDVVAREPQHLVTLRFEPPLAALVEVDLRLETVAVAVQLDHEAGSGAGEVDDVFTDGMLPAELPTFDLPAP
jgi:hypothetical protein